MSSLLTPLAFSRLLACMCLIPLVDGVALVGPAAEPKPEEARRLLAIRAVGSDLKSKADAPRYSKLEEYFLETNPKLVHLLNDLKQSAGKKEKHHGLTYVAAPAGAGKSFLFGSFAKQRADQTWKLDLGKLRGKPIPTRQVTDLQALAAPDPELSSSMLAFGRAGDPPGVQPCPPLPELAKALGADLTADPRPFLLIDSLDEIHPLSSLSVLERVDEMLMEDEKKNPAGFLHVFVVGRPEGFKMYYRDRHSSRYPDVLEMKLPDYRTMKDLEVAIESSRVFNKRSQKDAAAVLALAAKHRCIAESVHLLYLQSELLNDGAREFVEKNNDVRTMKDVLFGKMLERNHAVMQCPTFKVEFYVDLLRAIASKYTNVDENGFFHVDWVDSITIECVLKGRKVKRTFNVSNVLNRSGVAYLEPSDFRKPRYRFLPSWLHEHLVHRGNAAR